MWVGKEGEKVKKQKKGVTSSENLPFDKIGRLYKNRFKYLSMQIFK